MAGIDEGEVSVVNLGDSKPLAGVVAEELVACDPLRGSEVVLHDDIECLEDFWQCEASHVVQERGVQVRIGVSGCS